MCVWNGWITCAVVVPQPTSTAVIMKSCHGQNGVRPCLGRLPRSRLPPSRRSVTEPRLRCESCSTAVRKVEQRTLRSDHSQRSLENIGVFYFFWSHHQDYSGKREIKIFLFFPAAAFVLQVTGQSRQFFLSVFAFKSLNQVVTTWEAV